MFKQRLFWRLNRWLRQITQQLDSIENLWRGTQVRTRMCPNCRALVGVDEKICSFCNTKLGYRASGIGKLIQNIAPNFAPVSYSLLSANFIFFVLIFMVERDLTTQDLRQLLSGGNSRTLAMWGADAALLVIEGGQWWRLFSAIFIHAGMIHLLFNSYALIFIGPLLEEALGRERFLVLYLTTGAFGFLLSNWYYPPILVTVGASGAIFGMIGAAIVLSWRWSTWGSMMGQQLVHWAIYGFVYGLFLGANNAAHLGGFLSGAGLAYVLPNPNRAVFSKRIELLWKILYWLFIIIACLSLGLAIRFRINP